MVHNWIELNERLRNIESLLLSKKTVFNFDELAAYTGLSKSHLYKLTSTGGIPCYKPQGKHIYASKEEVDNWLLKNKKASNEEVESQAATYIVTSKRSSL